MPGASASPPGADVAGRASMGSASNGSPILSSAGPGSASPLARFHDHRRRGTDASERDLEQVQAQSITDPSAAHPGSACAFVLRSGPPFRRQSPVACGGRQCCAAISGRTSMPRSQPSRAWGTGDSPRRVRRRAPSSCRGAWPCRLDGFGPDEGMILRFAKHCPVPRFGETAARPSVRRGQAAHGVETRTSAVDSATTAPALTPSSVIVRVSGVCSPLSDSSAPTVRMSRVAEMIPITRNGWS
jgi:hypothetical protein